MAIMHIVPLQEKYLSEHNYDEQVDEDAALKILNFGDDYRNYIDSLSDGLSSRNEKKRQKKKFRKYKVIDNTSALFFFLQSMPSLTKKADTK